MNILVIVLHLLAFLAVIPLLGAASRRVAKNFKKVNLFTSEEMPSVAINSLANMSERNVKITGKVVRAEYSLTPPQLVLTIQDNTGKVPVVFWDRALATKLRDVIKQNDIVDAIGYVSMFSGAPSVYISGLGHKIVIKRKEKEHIFEAGLPEAEVAPSYTPLEFLTEEEKRILGIKEPPRKKPPEEKKRKRTEKQVTRDYYRVIPACAFFAVLLALTVVLYLASPATIQWDRESTVVAMSKGRFVVLENENVFLSGIQIENAEGFVYELNRLCPVGTTVLIDMLGPNEGVVYIVTDGKWINVNKSLVEKGYATETEAHSSWAAEGKLYPLREKTAVTALFLLAIFIVHVAATYVSENVGRAKKIAVRSKAWGYILPMITGSAIIGLVLIWNEVIDYLVFLLSNATIWHFIWIFIFVSAMSIRAIYLNDILAGLKIMLDPNIDVLKEIEVKGVRGIIQDVTLTRVTVALPDGGKLIIPNGQITTQIFAVGPTPREEIIAKLEEDFD